MPRKNLIKSDCLPYHVTARSNNREEFPLSLEKIWKILESECRSVSLNNGAEVQALVLMPNHFHLLITTPADDLGKVMNRFMGEVTVAINRISGKSGHQFGGPYHWTLIDSTRYFRQVLKYIYRNPVRSGLCATVEDYPHSTFHGLIGRSHLPFPIYYTRVGMELNLPDESPLDWVDWLNEPFLNETEKLIRAALKRRIFGNLIAERTKSQAAAKSALDYDSFNRPKIK